MSVPEPLPPTTSTLPSSSSVAVWPARPLARLPVGRQTGALVGVTVRETVATFDPADLFKLLPELQQAL